MLVVKYTNAATNKKESETHYCDPLITADAIDFAFRDLPEELYGAELFIRSGQIHAYAFRRAAIRLHLTGVDISNAVVDIGRNAFSHCSSLVEVLLPAHLRDIPSDCFCQCRSLASVGIPALVETIGASAFNGCVSLGSVYFLGDHVTTIMRDAFSQCTSLGFLSLPDSVRTVGPRAFERCQNLTTMSLGKHIVSMGACAFAKCGLEHVDISFLEGMTIISNGCFSGCPNLRSVLFSKSIVTIERYAFMRCSQLRSVRTVEPRAFERCKSGVVYFGAFAFAHTLVDDIDFSSAEWVAEGAFKDTRFVSLTLPTGDIGEDAFARCEILEEIALIGQAADGEICEGGFRENPHLKRILVDIPIELVGTEAFAGCPNLDYVVFKVNPAMLGPLVFMESDPSCVLIQHAETEELREPWATVFDEPAEGDPNYLEDEDAPDWEQVPTLDRDATAIWTSDDVLKATLGEETRFIAPGATTWAALELWMWWSPPHKAGYTNRNGVCADKRLVGKARRVALFAATAAAAKAARADSRFALDPPIWLIVFSYVKHDEIPSIKKWPSA